MYRARLDWRHSSTDVRQKYLDSLLSISEEAGRTRRQIIAVFALWFVTKIIGVHFDGQSILGVNLQDAHDKSDILFLSFSAFLLISWAIYAGINSSQALRITLDQIAHYRAEDQRRRAKYAQAVESLTTANYELRKALKAAGFRTVEAWRASFTQRDESGREFDISERSAPVNQAQTKIERAKTYLSNLRAETTRSDDGALIARQAFAFTCWHLASPFFAGGIVAVCSAWELLSAPLSSATSNAVHHMGALLGDQPHQD